MTRSIRCGGDRGGGDSGGGDSGGGDSGGGDRGGGDSGGGDSGGDSGGDDPRDDPWEDIRGCSRVTRSMLSSFVHDWAAKKKKIEALPPGETARVQRVQRDGSSNSSSSSSSDSDDEEVSVPPTSRPRPSSSSSSSSDSSDDSDVEPTPTGQTASNVPPTSRPRSSSSSSSSSDSSDDSDVEPTPTGQTAPNVPPTSRPRRSSSSSSSSDSSSESSSDSEREGDGASLTKRPATAVRARGTPSAAKVTAPLGVVGGHEILVKGMPFKTVATDVQAHFRDCGNIVCVKNKFGYPATKLKGICLVQFEDAQSVNEAIKLYNRSTMGGRWITVEKATSITKTGKAIGSCKICVKNLPFEGKPDDDDLFTMFARCSSTGKVLSVKRANNEDGSFRGFAFVILEGTYVKKEVEAMNGAERFNRKLKVHIVDESGKKKQKGVYLGKRKLNPEDDAQRNADAERMAAYYGSGGSSFY